MLVALWGRFMLFELIAREVEGKECAVMVVVVVKVLHLVGEETDKSQSS